MAAVKKGRPVLSGIELSNATVRSSKKMKVTKQTSKLVRLKTFSITQRTYGIYVHRADGFDFLNCLGAMMKYVDDFSVLIVVCFGADAKLTAFVWGSIRLILTLASKVGYTLQDVLDVLEELSLTLSRLRTYEQTPLIDIAFEMALLDVYTEVICFHTRPIRFFRSYPNSLLLRNAWAEFYGDFSPTPHHIKRLSSTVEGEAYLTRMRIDKEKYHEISELMKDLKRPNADEEDRAIQQYLIPHELSLRFWGREQALQAVRSSLDLDENIDTLGTFALYGTPYILRTSSIQQESPGCVSAYDVQASLQRVLSTPEWERKLSLS
jgi:hypothetical protein